MIGDISNAIQGDDVPVPSKAAMNLTFGKKGLEKTGTPVYVRCKEHGWIPGTLMEELGIGRARVSINEEQDTTIMMGCREQKGGKTIELIVDLEEYENRVLPLQNVDGHGNLQDYSDMVKLPYLHEPAILLNLKLRYVNSKPYTRAGESVIAVNPYQWLNHLYTDQVKHQYANKLIWEVSDRDPRGSLEPHVYEVSSRAYRGMAFDGHDQSILVSGESGAGKTETVKICMDHIAHVQQGPSSIPSSSVVRNRSKDDDSQIIVQRILDSNPLLEAFGNAQTQRNDNSSRFGKYTQLQFNRVGGSFLGVKSSAKLVGSKCEVYLLEKNRVTSHMAEERTYHIFYQLLAAPEEEKAKYWDGLVNTSFAYVGPTQTNTIEGRNDAKSFRITMKALRMLGLGDEKRRDLFRAICIVLQLGNLTFMPNPVNEEQSLISSLDDIKGLAKLMGIPETTLTIDLTERTMKTRGEVCKIYLNADKAKDSCDALAKEIYGNTFLWLVNTINNATSVENNYPIGIDQSTTDVGVIGLLDIFGFESFEVNRFEQLCINYANEKLQQKFTEDVFQSVQAEYIMEGLSLADISHKDNADVLNLIEGRTGLLAMLNEECVLPKRDAANFVRKAVEQNKTSPCLIIANRMNKTAFGIRHFAGDVLYDAENFTLRNLDTLPNDLKHCASTSSNAILSESFGTTRETNNASSIKPRRRGKSGNIMTQTIWSRYREQLADLMLDLRKTESRYIRCIKPNAVKKPTIMEHQITMQQLLYSGVIAGITISRSTFPNRLQTSVVLARYNTLWDREKFPPRTEANAPCEIQRREDCIALLTCALQSKKLVFDSLTVDAFVVGKTRTYFRAGALEYLQSKRVNDMEYYAINIQRFYRGSQRKQRERERRRRGFSQQLERKKYTTEINSLKNMIQDANQQLNLSISLIMQRKEHAVKQTAMYTRKTEELLKSETLSRQKLYTELDLKLKESSETIRRLESIKNKLSIKEDTIADDQKYVREESQKLKEAIEERNKAKKRDNKSYNRMRSESARLQQENRRLEEDVKKKKFMAMMKSKERFDAKTDVTKILGLIKESCKDPSLINAVTAIVKDCDDEAYKLLVSFQN